MKSCMHILVIVLLLVVGVGAQNQPDQTTTTLTGAVYDHNGAVVVNGTRVSAQSRDGKKYEAATNDEGIYKLQLPLAVYRVEAAAPGFCPTAVESFRVVNATHGRMSLDFVLEVASSHTACSRAIKDQTKPHERKQKNQQATERLLKQ